MIESVSQRYYVYTHVYPEGFRDGDGKDLGGVVFYIGKGIGNRIYDHERDAREGGQSPLCEIIRQIWSQGKEVVKRKEQEDLLEEDALALESRLISSHPRLQLANKLGVTKRMKQTIHLSPSLGKWLKHQAIEEEREISNIAEEALEHYRRMKSLG
jgi:hypothetical protein